MSVLNELIGGIKFIKFFAWEDRWIQRVLDAREVELEWIGKGESFGVKAPSSIGTLSIADMLHFCTARVNSVLFTFTWTCAPILVSIVSFFVYVAQGNELTVGTAFTVGLILFSSGF